MYRFTCIPNETFLKGRMKYIFSIETVNGFAGWRQGGGRWEVKLKHLVLKFN